MIRKGYWDLGESTSFEKLMVIYSSEYLEEQTKSKRGRIDILRVRDI